MKLKLDKINIAILSYFVKNGKINYSKLGKRLGLSHVSIKNRFEKLLEKKIIKPNVSINYSELDFSIGVLLIEIGNEGLKQLIDICQNCPRIIYSYNIVGEYNHCLIFFAENMETLETMLHSCMLYNLNGVRKSNIMIFGKNNEDIYLPLRWHLLETLTEDTPCGTNCKYCKAFINEKCLGCPSSKCYRGSLKITE